MVAFLKKKAFSGPATTANSSSQIKHTGLIVDKHTRSEAADFVVVGLDANNRVGNLAHGEVNSRRRRRTDAAAHVVPPFKAVRAMIMTSKTVLPASANLTTTSRTFGPEILCRFVCNDNKKFRFRAIC
jgi:hypothetical protein